jgi:hypothetical protein
MTIPVTIETWDGKGNLLATTQVDGTDITAAVNSAAIIQKIAAALTANQAFLAKSAPSNADVVAQVKVMTRELNAILRLIGGQLDTISDT